MKYLSDRYAKVYTYKGYDICTLKIVSPENGDELDYYVDDEKFKDREYINLGKAIQDIDKEIRIAKGEASPSIYQSDYSRGLEDGIAISDESYAHLFPFRVFKDHQAEQWGISPIHEIRCAFTTRQQADEFIKGQKAIDPKTKYIVKEVPDIEAFRKELGENGYIPTDNLCQGYRKLVQEAGKNVSLQEISDAYKGMPADRLSGGITEIGNELKAQEIMMQSEIELGAV